MASGSSKYGQLSFTEQKNGFSVKKSTENARIRIYRTCTVIVGASKTHWVLLECAKIISLIYHNESLYRTGLSQCNKNLSLRMEF